MALTLAGASYQEPKVTVLTWVHWWGHLTALTLDRMSHQLAEPLGLMWAPLWELTMVKTMDSKLAAQWEPQMALKLDDASQQPAMP